MPARMNLATGQTAVSSGVSANPVAAVVVYCGFTPRYVKIVVPKTGLAGMVFEWFHGMAAGRAIEYRQNSGFSCDEIASNGITVGARGFTIGTGCQLASGDTFRWIAMG